MKNNKYLGLIAGSLVAIAVISVKTRAESTNDSEWGDLGYSNPQVVVEEIPMSLAETDTAQEVPQETFNLNEPASPEVRDTVVAAETILPKAKPQRVSNISTVQNTYGVITEEKTPITFFVSPFAGVSSVFGNDTADSVPQYALGGTVGLLVSSNMRLDLSYTYSEENFSNPRINTTSGVSLLGDANVFQMKQNSFTAGVKLYVLGRESRFRPFLGGGGGYTRGTLNYTDPYLRAFGYQSQYTNDFTLTQINGYGELGAELAFNKHFVATAAFRLSGVVSSNTSASNATNSLNYDDSKLDVGNSLSRTASYLVSAGLGIYF